MIETRPWGNFTVLYSEDKCKVKKIIVLPGERLSYQFHRKRSENWTIICGFAEFTLEDKIIFLEAGNNIFIPLGFKHRVKNIGKENLEIIEVQYGEYLEEDDIVRIKDDYNRAK